jgi:hypothetical protein
MVVEEESTSLPLESTSLRTRGESIGITSAQQEYTFETWMTPMKLTVEINRKRNIVSSCISSSGNTVGIISDHGFTVFAVSQDESRRLRCVGVIDNKLHFQYGKDPKVLKPQLLSKLKGDARFTCGAVSDEFLAIGCSNFMMVFSILQAGRCVLEHEIPFDESIWIANKLLFDQESSILIAIFTNTVLDKEMAQFFSLKHKRSSGSETHLQETSIKSVSESVSWSISSIVHEKDGADAEYIVSTSCATLSADCTKLALCSHHVRGCAVIRLLIKDHGSWRFWGAQHIVIHSDHRNWSLPGFTGVAL